MSSFVPKRTRRAYPALVILLALSAHLAVMALPAHAQAMLGEAAHLSGTPDVVDESEHQPQPWPDTPVRPHWDACGLEAAPPAFTPSRVGIAVLTYGIQETLQALGATGFCQLAVQNPDPPPGDRLALLRVFRL